VGSFNSVRRIVLQTGEMRTRYIICVISPEGNAHSRKYSTRDGIIITKYTTKAGQRFAGCPCCGEEMENYHIHPQSEAKG
jgi:hypothetical protein